MDKGCFFVKTSYYKDRKKLARKVSVLDACPIKWDRASFALSLLVYRELFKTNYKHGRDGRGFGFSS